MLVASVRLQRRSVRHALFRVPLARPLGAGQFRVRSIPTLATGVSFGDVVLCRAATRLPLLVAVAEPGGHRTVQVLLAPDASREAVLLRLPLRLSSSESVDDRHLAIDVHPEENWGEVTERLDRLQRGGELIWVEASARPIARVADETPA